MMKLNNIYRILTTSMFALVLVACANDDDDNDVKVGNNILNVIPSVYSFVDSNPLANVKTRAVTDGYEKYSSADETSKIKVYLAKLDNTVDGNGQFYYKSTSWQSTVQVDPEIQYYIYGFMPAGGAEASISSSNYSNDYSKGATITLSNLKTIMPSDVCVITGVLKGSTDDSPADIIDMTDVVKQGNFAYFSSEEKKNNNVYILLNHIYSSVKIQFAVDESYDALRTIRLKNITINTATGGQTTTATINLTANTNESNPMSFTVEKASNAETQGTSFSADLDDMLLNSSLMDAVQFYIPGWLASNTFEVVTTYDVYDEDATEANNYMGNLVRENCVATNKLTLDNPKTAAGYNYLVKMTVIPTYLYQLSDPDLDNPTIQVEN